MALRADAISARRLGDLLLGVALLGAGALGRGLGLLGAGQRLLGGPLRRRAGLGGDGADLVARRGPFALERRPRLGAGGLDRLLGALGGRLRLGARGVAVHLRLLGLLARRAQLGGRARGALLDLLAGLLERALALALRALQLAARREHLALALGDGRLELRARLALGGDALVELGARDRDLLASQARLLLGGGAGLLVEGDALGELLRLAVAAAQRGLGLRAQPGELLARLAGGLLGGAAQAPLGLQAPFERGHRLAALLGGALGDLAAAALLDERRGAGRRRGGGRGPLRLGAAAGGLLRARQVDDAAARLQGEGEMAVGQQRGGRRVGGAPGRRIGTRQRRRVVGPGQRRQAAGAAPVVEQQHRRREALARVRAPVPGDPQQHVVARGDALEALDLEFGGPAAQDGAESRSASAMFASFSTFSGVSSASSTRKRPGSAAASSS